MTKSKVKNLLLDCDVLNYFAKADCLQVLIANCPYQLFTTVLIRQELQDGLSRVPSLQQALGAIDRGQIALEPLIEADLNEMVHLQTQFDGLSDADRSLMALSKRLGWQILTNDGSMQRKTKRLKLPVLRLEDFLKMAEREGWLMHEQVIEVKQFAGL